MELIWVFLHANLDDKGGCTRGSLHLYCFRGTCVCEQRLLPASGTAVTRTRDLLSRKSSTLTTAPPGHAGQVCGGGEMSYSREGRERVGPGRTFHSCASDKRPARRSGFVDRTSSFRLHFMNLLPDPVGSNVSAACDLIL